MLSFLQGAIKMFCNFDIKNNNKISITLLFFDIVSYDVNAFFATFLVSRLCLEKRVIHPALQTTLQQQLLAIRRLQTGTMKMRFQTSQQITVIRSQICSVGRVV